MKGITVVVVALKKKCFQQRRACRKLNSILSLCDHGHTQTDWSSKNRWEKTSNSQFALVFTQNGPKTLSHRGSMHLFFLGIFVHKLLFCPKSAKTLTHIVRNYSKCKDSVFKNFFWYFHTPWDIAFENWKFQSCFRSKYKIFWQKIEWPFTVN